MKVKVNKVNGDDPDYFSNVASYEIGVETGALYVNISLMDNPIVEGKVYAPGHWQSIKIMKD